MRKLWKSSTLSVPLHKVARCRLDNCLIFYTDEIKYILMLELCRFLSNPDLIMPTTELLIWPLKPKLSHNWKRDLARSCLMSYTPSLRNFRGENGNFRILFENFEKFFLQIYRKFWKIVWTIMSYNFQRRRQIITPEGTYECKS